MSARKDNDIFDTAAPALRSSTSQSTRLSRLMREAGWIVFLALAFYLVLIFATYHATDPGYFFSGKGGAILNKGGTTGAWISDLAFGLSGISAWWWVALAAYAVMRLFYRVEVWGVFDHRNIAIALIGFAILLLASSTLEALRLHSLTTPLPNGPGGVIGALFANGIERGLGFTGGTLLLLAVCAGAISVFSGLSWIRLAEKLGTGVEWLWMSARGKIEARRDRNAGEQAVEAREEKVEEMKRSIEDHPPIRIEPTITEIPQSERVRREKQVQLFADLPDSPLPPIALLDPADASMSGRATRRWNLPLA